jgi:hypothetical protein
MLRFKAALLLALIVLSGCNSNQAIARFAENAKALNDLLPRVAVIPFNSCVERWTYTQLAIKDSRSFPNPSSATTACQDDQKAGDRLNKEFSVLSAYLIGLGALATANHQEALKQEKAVASKSALLSGANPAISDLSAAFTNAVLKARTARALRQAITDANPHVQALCSGFQKQIARIPALALDNQELELRALFADSLPATPATRLLLYRDFDSRLAQISQARQITLTYATLLGSIAKAHQNLYDNRDNLRSPAALAQILEDTETVGEQIKTIQLILK